MSEKEYKLEGYNKVSYLNMLQNIITRMAGNSAIMKGFASTIIVGVLGLTVANMVEWYHIAISLIPMISFVYLDIYYLKMERKYRNLYALISRPDTYIDHYYSLDLKNKVFKKYEKTIYEKTEIYRLIISHSIAGFYGWFIITSILCIIIA